MMDHEAERLRAEFLRRLDAALTDVPHGVATEIRDAIAEGLAGVESDAVAARIAELGDPAKIARDALAAADPTPQPVMVVEKPGRAPIERSRGFAILAALVVAFGGLILFGIGWACGIGMMWMSGLWRRWEKWVAMLAPWVAIGAGALVRLIGGGSGQGFNPLAAFSEVTLVMIILVPATGLWLLWRLRGRTVASDL